MTKITKKKNNFRERLNKPKITYINDFLNIISTGAAWQPKIVFPLFCLPRFSNGVIQFSFVFFGTFRRRFLIDITYRGNRF